MDGFVTTPPRDPTDTNCPGVYALDCEKCYTIDGLELSRVTVVNSSLQIVYDTFVRPNHEVIDYNTRFSGICEEDMKGHCHSLTEVQENLLSFINADTILIGHGLETNLCVLKLLHGMVVDTSVVFPHRLGLPHKLSLHSLTAEYLRKIIQESVYGHDTAEDAVACMELLIWKAKEDGKLKKTL